MLAVIASITFAPTANLIIEAANLGEAVSLPVGDLIKTVAFLQILPFVVGLLIRHWNEKSALEWNEFAKKVSGPAFLVVVVLALLGSWQTIIDLIGDRALLAGILFAAVMIVIGWFLSSGDRKTRSATALIQPGSNAGPAFAAEGNVAAAEVSELTEDEAMTYGAWLGALFGLGAGGEEGAEMGALVGAIAAADEYEYGLDEEAITSIADDIPAGGAAMMLVVDHQWAIPFRNAMRASGGTLITQDFINPEALIAFAADVALEG